MANNQQKRVIVFSTPSCPWCRRVKSYLHQNNIRFKDLDVSRNLNAARDMVRMTGQQGVPVVLINNRPIVGFQKDKIDRLLEIKGRN